MDSFPVGEKIGQMRKEIISLLKKEKIDFWKIEEAEIERSNIYFEKNEEESHISGKRKDYLVTVYKKEGDFLGESAVTIKEGDSISKKIKEAVVASRLIKNPYYVPFEKFSLYPKAKKAARLPSREELVKRVKEAYDEIGKTTAVLNAFEVHTKKSRITVITSIGQELGEEHNGAYAECAVTAKGRRGEMEYVGMRQEATIGQINLRQFASETCKVAIDVSNSTSPKKFKGNVVLTGDALAEFFMTSPQEDPVVIHSSARMKYLRLSKFEIGRDFEKGIKGDRITFSSNPLIENALRSSAFDSNLVPAKKTVLIENGIFKNFFAGKRYADYLKITPTGPLGNIEIDLGSTPMNDFFRDGNCEIASFSWFSPSVYSGDFTAEIRLGYLIKNDKKIPFKGGMWVGNYFRVLADCVLAKEKWFKSGYYGPKAIMFRNSVISGS